MKKTLLCGLFILFSQQSQALEFKDISGKWTSACQEMSQAFFTLADFYFMQADDGRFVSTGRIYFYSNLNRCEERVAPDFIADADSQDEFLSQTGNSLVWHAKLSRYILTPFTEFGTFIMKNNLFLDGSIGKVSVALDPKKYPDFGWFSMMKLENDRLFISKPTFESTLVNPASGYEFILRKS